MFGRYLLLILTIVSVSQLFLGQSYGQEEARERFALFQNINGFQSDALFKLHSNNYISKMTCLDETIGESRIKSIQKTTSARANGRYYVDPFEDVQAQKHQKINSDSAKEKKIYFTLRIGFGESEELGGASQGAIDIKPGKFPIAISILSEAYRRMPLQKHYAEPDDASFTAINVLYMKDLFRTGSVNIFLGGGIGGLELCKYERTDDPSWDDEPYAIERGVIYNLEAGVNFRLLWKRRIGLYAVSKYIYANKKKNGVKVIDLNSTAWLLGLTLNFGLFDKAH